MAVSLTPVGPGLPTAVAQVLKSHEDAIRALQQPGYPTALHHIDTKANLPTASDWPACVAICDEINSIVVSTLVAGSYAWLRADGSAL